MYIYPPYESITEAKKKCYPETKAEVPLQNLLDNTADTAAFSERSYFTFKPQSKTKFVPYFKVGM